MRAVWARTLTVVSAGVPRVLQTGAVLDVILRSRVSSFESYSTESQTQEAECRLSLSGIGVRIARSQECGARPGTEWISRGTQGPHEVYRGPSWGI